MRAPTDTYDRQKVADTVLALLHLNLFHDHGPRAWKTFDWDAMDLLFEQGMIGDPKSKAKSVVVTEQGAERARQLFEEMFGV